MPRNYADLEAACTCTTWCGDPGEAGCPACDDSDVYWPCPKVGFGCGIGADPDTEPCECCSPEQWRAAISDPQRADALGGDE